MEENSKAIEENISNIGGNGQGPIVEQSQPPTVTNLNLP
jgi:hypothetical protein